MCWGWELPGRGRLRAAPPDLITAPALLAELLLLLLLWQVSLAHRNGPAALPEPATVAVMKEVLNVLVLGGSSDSHPKGPWCPSWGAGETGPHFPIMEMEVLESLSPETPGVPSSPASRRSIHGVTWL